MTEETNIYSRIIQISKTESFIEEMRRKIEETNLYLIEQQLNDSKEEETGKSEIGTNRKGRSISPKFDIIPINNEEDERMNKATEHMISFWKINVTTRKPRKQDKISEKFKGKFNEKLIAKIMPIERKSPTQISFFENFNQYFSQKEETIQSTLGSLIEFEKHGVWCKCYDCWKFRCFTIQSTECSTCTSCLSDVFDDTIFSYSDTNKSSIDFFISENKLLSEKSDVQKNIIKEIMKIMEINRELIELRDK
ncbi:unnamed protein product [Caenorhabditis angaria]|uniref:Uncharacterized protein n=1 Tax=Caenorhabditis angaria TaxID=860376 RepID=A0A9P1IAL5_9PELO|nr:unnamed protein product [Caenorhabditis angaria]